MFDVDIDGKVDRVLATFSEALASSTLTTPWMLAAVPGGGTLLSVSTSGSVTTLLLTEGAVNTAVGTFSVALAANASGIRDAAGNQSTFAATAPADKAGPVVLSVAEHDDGFLLSDGKLGTDDWLAATFSEAIAAGVTTPTTITESNPGSGFTLLTIGGFTNGALNMGSNYLTLGNSITFAATAALSNVNRTLTVTAGNCSSGCLLTNLLQGSAGNGMDFVPAPGLTDAAGNPAVGTVETNTPLF